MSLETAPISKILETGVDPDFVEATLKGYLLIEEDFKITGWRPLLSTNVILDTITVSGKKFSNSKYKFPLFSKA